MAAKKSSTTTAGAASEPVDYSQVSQDSALTKPSKEDLEKSGYRIPDAFYTLEEAGGNVEAAAQLQAEQSDPPLTQDEINARADEEQAANQQKNAGGPAANKSATPTARKRASRE